MTLPFCFGTLAFVLLHTATKDVTWVPPADITTPEEHLRRARLQASPNGGPPTGEDVS